MNPGRLSVAFPAAGPPADLEPAIGMFHRFIQRGQAEGLILDVADYRHVPQGPGVLLVGHDVDYGISPEAFTVLRKRSSADSVGTQLRDLLRMGLGAIDAIAYDGALDARFDTSRLTVSVLDRQLGSASEVESELRAEVEPVVSELYGLDATIASASGDDPRRRPSLDIQARGAEGVLDKLGGSQAPGQSAWDIPVEELVRLRENGAEFVLLDVREDSEYETVNLGGKHIPLVSLGEHLGELDKSAKIVTHCRAGRRGAKAADQLRAAGFEDAWNLNGGLMAWIDRVDPTLPRY